MIVRALLALVGSTIATTILVAPALRAQEPATGRLSGMVHETVPSRRVDLASISLVRIAPEPELSFATHADSSGHFDIDVLPAGRYIVRVSTPLLDSLDLALPERELTVVAGETVHADYALPYGDALRNAVCPGVILGDGKAVVAGRATDAATGLPIAGADVVVEWSEVMVDRSTLVASTTEQTATVKTGPRGEYRLCGVPTGAWLSVQLQQAERAGPTVRVTVSNTEGVVLRDLSLRERPTQTNTSGSASITGIVRGAGGVPLADVQLRIQDGIASATSDSTGRFLIPGLPEGPQMLLARRLGYSMAEVPVELHAGSSVRRDVQLVRAITLDTIMVSDYATRFREFEFNRGMNIISGDFLTSEMIARGRAVETGDLVDRMPGFRVVGHGAVAKVFTIRGMQNNSSCQANVVVDGVEEMGVNEVPPSMVQGIEAYVRPPKPSVYHRVGCGLVVVWTKNWRRPSRPAPLRADTSMNSRQ